jgi:putative beta-lysine N-acetyltransferase
MKLNPEDFPEILETLKNLAFKESYTKIFAKIPSWYLSSFELEGFKEEAQIPKFFNGQKAVSFVSKFLDNARSEISNEEKQEIALNLDLAMSKQGSTTLINNNPSFSLRILQKEDISKLSKLYKKVFPSYPFPIFDKKYLTETMDNDVVYFGVFKGKKLISASSAEMDLNSENAEMTDFATDPDYAGNNLSLLLLRAMEEAMILRKIKTAYTIARSYSKGMNITFAKQDYEYTGTLINNTNIFGNIESMNVWYKSLS